MLSIIHVPLNHYQRIFLRFVAVDIGVEAMKNYVWYYGSYSGVVCRPFTYGHFWWMRVRFMREAHMSIRSEMFPDGSFKTFKLKLRILHQKKHTYSFDMYTFHWQIQPLYKRLPVVNCTKNIIVSYAYVSVPALSYRSIHTIFFLFSILCLLSLSSGYAHHKEKKYIKLQANASIYQRF